MTLYDNEREDNQTPVQMTIKSRVPSKWRFADLETGDVWRFDAATGRFRRALDVSVNHYGDDAILLDTESIEAGRHSLKPTAPRWMGRFGVLFGVTQHNIDKAAKTLRLAAEAELRNSK